MIELNHYYNCDCMDLMKQLPDKFVDLAIVDPPYGLERFKKGGSHLNKYGSPEGIWNNEKPKDKYFEELFRISKFQIIWGGNNFNLPTSEYYLVWVKPDHAFDFSFAMCEYAWTNCKIPAKVFYINSKDKSTRVHPTQKPVELYEKVLKTYAKQGDIILDTHCGSASSLIACHRMGFDYIGCELDEHYYKLSKERLEAEKAQLRLF